MRVLALAAAVAITACAGPASPVASRSASASRSIAPSSTPDAPSPAPTSGGGAIAFSCRLPILWFSSDPRVDAKVGFISFPSGSLSTLTTQLPKPPPLTIDYSYDLAVQRWLAVNRAAVAPDGLHYAYAEYDPAGANDGRSAIGSKGRVHIVDVKTGADRVIFAGAPTFAIVDFSGTTLWLARFAAGIAGSSRRGLYRMSPTGGTPQLLPGSDVELDGGGWRALDHGAAWGTRFSATAGLGSGNEVVRYDVTSHAVESWYQAPVGQVVGIVGFEKDGRPLIGAQLAFVTEAESPQGAFYLLRARNQPTALGTTGGQVPLDFGVSDTHGVWTGGAGTVWFHAPSGGFGSIRVLDDPNLAVTVGGGCV